MLKVLKKHHPTPRIPTTYPLYIVPKSAGAYSIIIVSNALKCLSLLSFFDFFEKFPLHCLFSSYT